MVIMLDNDGFFLKNASDLDSARLKNTQCESEVERLEEELENFKIRVFELGERIIEIDETEKLMGEGRLQWIRDRFQELREENQNGEQ